MSSRRWTKKIPGLNLDSLEKNPKKSVSSARENIYIKESNFKVRPVGLQLDPILMSGSKSKDQVSMTKTKESSATNRFQQFAETLMLFEDQESGSEHISNPQKMA